MTLAIANHEMAKAAFPDAFGDTTEEAEPPTPCGHLDPAGEMICVGNAGHRGRHKYRRFEVEESEAEESLVN